MNTIEYVTLEEVRKVCEELKIRDWTRLDKPKVQSEEARVILSKLNVGAMKIEIEDFRQGLEVELEHGISFKDANVTNNHPILTGKIVLAHLKESLDYYMRLEVAEIEGDLFKAAVSKDSAKLAALYKKLIDAKLILSKTEARQLA
ncbi:MAG: DUF5661 family protein [Candidatus Sifarchaeia archaeon]|jgi:hypothetical protein